MHMLWHLLCTITVIHGQQYLDHRKTAATGVPHWHDAPPRIGDLKVLHRSHNFSAAALTAGSGGARLGRTRRNVVSCAVENPDYATIWYDDAALDAFLDEVTDKGIALAPDGNATLQAFLDEVINNRIARAIATLRRPPFSEHFVLRTDLARLLLVRTYGGWWLDADAVCIDPLKELRIDGCVFAWEGSVADEPSAPLNWAFACEPGHEFPLHAALLASDRIAAFSGEFPSDASAERRARTRVGARIVLAEGCAGERRAYCAGGHIPVLDLTGPAMVGDALRAYAGASSNRALREAAGERADDASTWARATTVKMRRGGRGGNVTVLPYCFFRSRGCAHLAGPPYHDRVLFHHEFDTAWRPAFWHSHYPGSGGEL